MRPPLVFVAPEVRSSLQAGHPWVYRNQVQGERGGEAPRLPSGTWVRVHCGPFEGIGLWEAQGAIAVRLFEARTVPDAAWIAERVRAAWVLRAPVRARAGTDAYRWIYGESDGLPGVVVDLYGRFAAMHLYTEGLSVLQEPLVDALVQVAGLQGVVLRHSGAGVESAPREEGAPRDAGGGKARVIWGRPPPRDLVVSENGLRFHANLLEGQKTGLFLDHRENRAYLEPWCRGLRVLNAFAYTGAFSLYAARGGAAEITSVDAAPATAPEAQRNFSLNGYDPALYAFVVADCFTWLEQQAAAGRRFDLLILDPPSLAKDKASRHAAARAYTRLNRLALACLEPGGLLATASCTSQVSPELFREALAAAATQAGRRLLILHEGGHALDHPIPAQFPEARYLKFVLARAYGR
ncbi:MAG: class I SAM-dependent rRNA methyltransferase [Anaerolineae bacterium]